MFSIKIIKVLVSQNARIANREDLDQTASQQSGLGLNCFTLLSRPFSGTELVFELFEYLPKLPGGGGGGGGGGA